MNFLDGFVNRRQKQHRNVIIIIAAWNSETGTGKSTLAIRIGNRYDTKFSIDNVLFGTRKFIKLVHDSNGQLKGEWFALDEIGVDLDSRRSMSHTNVDFSQMLQIFRMEEINLVATLPSISVLDFRALELSDMLVLVMKRGFANTYKVRVNPLRVKNRIFLEEWDNLRWEPLNNEIWDKYLEKKREFLNDKYKKLLRGSYKPKKETYADIDKKFVDGLDLEGGIIEQIKKSKSEVEEEISELMVE